MTTRPLISCIVFGCWMLSVTPASAQSATLLSQTIWGTAGHESVEGLAVGPDGSTYLTGNHSLVGPPSKIFLVKFAPDGSIAWQQTWDGPDQFFDSRPTDVAVSADGTSVYVTGTAFINPNLAVLLKFDAATGSLVWAKSWGQNSFPQGVAVDADGAIYVSGNNNTSEDFHVFVTRFAADGTVVWHRKWNGATSGGDVALDGLGHVYVVGESVVPNSELFAFQVALLKLDTAGNSIWQRTVAEGEQLDARGGVAVGPDGSIYVAGGRLDGRDFAFDALVLKFAPDGTLLWNRTWGGRGHDEAGGVAVRADGAVFVTGTTNSFDSTDDAFYLQLAPAGGKAEDAALWGEPDTHTERGDAIAISPAGDAVIGATVLDPPYVFRKAPTRTSRLKVVVGDPNVPVVELGVVAVDAGGTVEPIAGTTNDDPGFDGAVVVIRP
jgi:DNA-binding beta-propeller fold protein YncE